LSGDAGVELQVIANASGPATATFQLSSRTAAEGGSASWKRHVSGRLRSTETSTVTQIAAPGEKRASGAQSVAVAEHYRRLSDRGLGYGPSFQGVLELWRDTHQAVAKLQVPLVAAPSSDAFHLHPILLDAAFQTLAAAIPSDATAATYLPVGLTALRQLAAPAGELWAVGRLRERAAGEPAGARLEGDAWITTGDGEVVVEARGLQLQRIEQPAVRKSALDEWLYDLTWEESPVQSGSADSQAGRWLICSDRHGVGSALKTALECDGHTVATVTPGSSFSSDGSNAYRVDASSPADFGVLLRELAIQQPALRGIVYSWTLDAAANDRLDGGSLAAAEYLGPGALVHLVQALAQAGWRDAPRLWLVTQGAQVVTDASDAVSVAQSLVWGLGRTIAHEHAELRCACVDLDPARDDAELLARVVALDDREDQIALRGGRRFVARLRRGCVAPRRGTRPRVAAGDTPFAVEIDTAGILDELTVRAAVRRAPEVHEVEIEVHAAGLNFLDVLSAMGLRPDTAVDQPIALGGECAGTVVAVGEKVTDFRVGDAVVALAPGTFRSYVTTPAMFVAVKPSRLAFEDAATLPIAFMTARYALLDLARLSKNESVLIHSAAGGVGLAAVQIAMRLGAQIFATAGSEEKRAFLRTLGLPYVMDSRSSSYVEEIRALTGGRGVDVVLNSLSGDAIAQSLSIVAPYGRFVEIGKRDIYQNTQIGLSPFRRNLSYYAVDLARMIDERPQLIQSLLDSTMKAAQAGELDALRKRVYPVGEVALAFREMAQAKHIGKLVVTLRYRDVLIEPAPPQPVVISADGTYLITGGVGGLGLTVAKWLVAQGARHLVLTSRGRGSAAAQDAIAALEQAGARVVVAPADVADRRQLAELLARIDADLPPVRGVVHAAGVLDDGLILQMTPDRLRRVAAPKIHGAWNLHSLLRDRPLDFFVLFSSAASWLGSPGQANYAAANAFLDALAQHRRGSGLPALSINWGPWAEVGLAAEQENRGARLAFRGITSFTPDEGADAFGALLGYDGAAVAVMALNLRQWRQSYPKAADMPLVAALLRDDAAGGERAKDRDAPLRQALTVAEPAQRRDMLEAHVREQLSAVLRLAPSRIDARTPFRNMGIDSLMALELRNRLEATVGVMLSATMVWNYPTIAALAPFLAERLGLDLKDNAQPGATGTAAEGAGAASIDHGELDTLSEDELAAMLAQELGALEQTKP
jgi:NADPH:quinone reductase-like Zn-dependent oxidoreductase/acyl carrier protein